MEQPQRPKARGLAPVGIMSSLAEPEEQKASICTVMEASICPGKLFYCELLSTPAVWNIVIACTQSSNMTQITHGRLGQFSSVPMSPL